jgi:hypothetical protein
MLARQDEISGISCGYSFAYALSGGLTPIIVTLLMKANPFGLPIYVAVLCGVSVGTAWFIRSTITKYFTNNVL